MDKHVPVASSFDLPCARLSSSRDASRTGLMAASSRSRCKRGQVSKTAAAWTVHRRLLLRASSTRDRSRRRASPASSAARYQTRCLPASGRAHRPAPAQRRDPRTPGAYPRPHRESSFLLFFSPSPSGRGGWGVRANPPQPLLPQGASLSGATPCMTVPRRGPSLVADRTARKPANNRVGEGQAYRDERIGEVPFRPRAGSDRRQLAVRARGENAAHARKRRKRSSTGRLRHGDASRGTNGLRSDRGRARL